jgi:hypothetical protein
VYGIKIKIVRVAGSRPGGYRNIKERRRLTVTDASSAFEGFSFPSCHRLHHLPPVGSFRLIPIAIGNTILSFIH